MKKKSEIYEMMYFKNGSPIYIIMYSHLKNEFKTTIHNYVIHSFFVCQFQSCYTLIKVPTNPFLFLYFCFFKQILFPF